MDEEWRGIPGFPDYAVSNLGNVLSSRTGRNKILKGDIKKAGRKNRWSYRRVTIQTPTHSENHKSIAVHRLVWKVFVGDIQDDQCLIFKNGNTLDPRLDNLELYIPKKRENKKSVIDRIMEEPVVSEFFCGHIDDVPRGASLGKIVYKILQPPWKDWPKNIPYSTKIY